MNTSKYGFVLELMIKVTLEATANVIKMHHGAIIQIKQNGCIILCAYFLQMPSRISALSIMEEQSLWSRRDSVLRRQKGEEDVTML